MPAHLATLLPLLLVVVLHVPPFESTAQRKNVLFLVADDMRPELGAYYGPDFPTPVHPSMHTPNLDALASRSLLLKRAYVQQALCSPSRTSVLTGRRPDTTRTYDLAHYFRHVAGNFTTIPQFFKQQGYVTAGMGKVFHPGATSGGDDPISWTEPYFHAKNAWGKFYAYSNHYIPDEQLKDQPLEDQLIARHAIETLQKVAPLARTGEKPFFVAVGFHRPHLPWVIPESFRKYYPIEDVKLPEYNYLPSLFPEIAWSTFADLKSYEDMRSLNQEGDMFNRSYHDDKVRSLRQAYYSAVSYTDSLVGLVVKELHNLGLDNDTVISFFGDHGYHLGEHAEWCKHNNFDLSVHAPFMVRVPGLTDKGVSTRALTELVDLFPTLADAAGVPPVPLCPRDPFPVALCTEGVSLMPLIRDPDTPWKQAAFSQYPRLDIGGSVVMGYTMRTDQYRYTEWIDYDYPTWTPNFNSRYPFVTGSELYDHNVNPAETINFVNDAAYKDVRERLAKMLRAGWRNALPPAIMNEKFSRSGTKYLELKENVEVEIVQLL